MTDPDPKPNYDAIAQLSGALVDLLARSDATPPEAAVAMGLAARAMAQISLDGHDLPEATLTKFGNMLARGFSTGFRQKVVTVTVPGADAVRVVRQDDGWTH